MQDVPVAEQKVDFLRVIIGFGNLSQSFFPKMRFGTLGEQTSVLEMQGRRPVL